ncbi:MAG: DMT family transporter [Candidatus Aquilonibacter sp.]
MSAFRLGLLAALAAASSWGIMFPVLKHLLLTLDPYWLTSIRYLAASAILAIALLISEGPRAFVPDRRGWLLLALGTAGIAVFNLFVLSGLERSSAEHGALVVATGPAMVALLLWARNGAVPSRLTFAMLVLAFVGVMLVITKGSLASLAGGSALGDALVALGVAGFAIYTAYTPAFSDYSRLRFATLSIILGTIATVIASIVAQLAGVAHTPSAVDSSVIVGMLYMIIFPAVLAFLFWTFAISKIGAQNTGLFMNAVPIVAFIIGICSGRQFSIIEYVGSALTIAALVINNLASRPAAVALSVPDRSGEPALR